MAVVGGPDEIVTDGLVLHLDAANPQSYPGTGTTWYDLSGNGNNFSLLNGPIFTNLQGESHISFDGTNEYLNPSNNSYTAPQLNPGSGNMSISCWFKRIYRSGSGYAGLVDARGNSLIGFLLIVDYGGRGRCALFYNDNINTAQNVLFFDGYPFTEDLLYNLVVTVDRQPNTMKLYKDGKFITERTINHSDSVEPTSFAYRIANDLGGPEYYGNIYNFMHYNRALSAQEVLQNYNATKQRFTNK